MARALNRHYAESKFTARKATWVATSSAGYQLPVLHFLKNTARPCSCSMCKQPRYVREPKHRQTSQE